MNELFGALNSRPNEFCDLRTIDLLLKTITYCRLEGFLVLSADLVYFLKKNFSRSFILSLRQDIYTLKLHFATGVK
jgi:hypothetical protein